MCAPYWRRFFHIGDIPTQEEVQSLYDPRRPSFSPEDLEFVANDDGDPEFEGNVPCTTEAVPTAMDLIDEGAAEPFSHFIEDGEVVKLATANGVIGSRQRLEVHIDELDVDVRPLVL